MRDKGDVLTGDGIERVSEEQSISAPHGGEGGSVLQALGSKGRVRELRAKRREDKKDSYAKYLEGSAWRKIRGAALKRDKHTCRACSAPAIHVHHVRYPKNLGEERMEWLYSLCAPCHNEIHKRASVRGVTLRAATNEVLNLPPKSKKMSRAQKRRVTSPLSPRLKNKGTKPKRTKLSVEAENDRLREVFRANRERRERRWDLGRS